MSTGPGIGPLLFGPGFGYTIDPTKINHCTSLSIIHHATQPIIYTNKTVEERKKKKYSIATGLDG